MHIFLDTTVTFSDPFFKKNYNRNLLRLAREYNDLTFYMSEIVYKETKRHFEINVKRNLEELIKVERKLQNYKKVYFQLNIDKEVEKERTIKGLLKDFETFYKELQDDNLLIILQCPDNILPELIDRSVNRIKPFKENKSEFRDAATWLTYAKYIEQNDLSDCYFITENVADFFDDKKENIHPELLKDTTKIKAFLTLTKLTREDRKIRLYLEEKQEKEEKIQKWIDEHSIDENYFLVYFKKSSVFDQIYINCSDYISSSTHIKVDGGEMYDDRVHALDDIDIQEIQDFNIEIIGEEIIVSGELIIEINYTYVIGFFDKSLWEPHDNIPLSMEILQPFSLTLLMDKSITNLQFEEIGIISKPRIYPTIYF